MIKIRILGNWFENNVYQTINKIIEIENKFNCEKTSISEYLDDIRVSKEFIGQIYIFN